MTQPGPKRHHYLPQCYLRRFADDREQLRVLPRTGATPYVTHIKTATAMANTDGGYLIFGVANAADGGEPAPRRTGLPPLRSSGRSSGTSSPP